MPLAVSFLRDKPLPNGRMRDELVRLSIRTLGKDNGHEHVERTLGVRMFVGLRERETRSKPYAYRAMIENQPPIERVRMFDGPGSVKREAIRSYQYLV